MKGDRGLRDDIREWGQKAKKNECPKFLIRLEGYDKLFEPKQLFRSSPHGKCDLIINGFCGAKKVYINKFSHL